MDINFWQKYDDAIPDLTVAFKRQGQVIVQVLFEVKLNAEKGDAGDPDLDQLVRYAKLAAKLSTIAPTFLIFPTPGDPLPDIQETLDLLITEPNGAGRVFGLQWGDLHAACLKISRAAVSNVEHQILRDVAAYLQKRDFDYFRASVTFSSWNSAHDGALIS